MILVEGTGIWYRRQSYHIPKSAQNLYIGGLGDQVLMNNQSDRFMRSPERVRKPAEELPEIWMRSLDARVTRWHKCNPLAFDRRP